MRRLHRRAFAVLLVAAAACATVPTADAAGPLPPFQVQRPDGSPAAGTELGGERWLLVYVVPASVGADRLLPVLEEDWNDALAESLVFVVAAAPEEARAYLERKGGSALAESVRWYADPDRSAARALELQGGLALFGVEQGAVDWKLDGVLEDPAAVTPVLKAWVEAR